VRAIRNHLAVPLWLTFVAGNPEHRRPSDNGQENPQQGIL
jgi:hypothetical protein